MTVLQERDLSTLSLLAEGLRRAGQAQRHTRVCIGCLPQASWSIDCSFRQEYPPRHLLKFLRAMIPCQYGGDGLEDMKTD